MSRKEYKERRLQGSWSYASTFFPLHPSIRFADRDSTIPEGTHAVHVAYSAAMRVLAVVVSTGRAVLVNMDGDGDQVDG